MKSKGVKNDLKGNGKREEIAFKYGRKRLNNAPVWVMNSKK